MGWMSKGGVRTERRVFNTARMLAVLTGLLLLGRAAVAGPPGPWHRAALIEFSGLISTLSEQYLYRKLDEAQRRNADLVIIEIDSPGGEIEPTMRIAERLRDLGWAHTVAFVPRQALSGAALFSLACDEIVLAPDAVFGDAGPIFLDEDFLFSMRPRRFAAIWRCACAAWQKPRTVRRRWRKPWSTWTWSCTRSAIATRAS